MSPKFNYLATDLDGDTYLYSEKPTMDPVSWVPLSGDCYSADAFTSFKVGTCDWEDSLVKRPD